MAIQDPTESGSNGKGKPKVARAAEDPLRTLLDALRALERGDLQVRLPVDGRSGILDEIARAFNGVAERNELFGCEIVCLARRSLEDEAVQLAMASDPRRVHLAELEATLDATIDSVLVIEGDLRIAYANQVAVAQLGWSREELQSMRVDEVEPGASGDEHSARIAALRAGVLPASTYRAVRRTRDGEEIPVEVTMQLVRTGATGRLVSVARDIRERLRAEEDLRRANEAKDAFVAAASHELRTPLAAAKVQAQLAMRRLRSEAEAAHAGKALRTITAQIDRMSKLVDDLLDVSRVQIGRLSLELAELDVVALVREVAERIQVLSERHELRLKVPGDELWLLGDRDRLDQVITNLLSNAIRYSPEGGPIDVEIEPEPEWIALVVKDRGIGIPPEEQQRIFEAFGRAHGSRYGGLGLGLTICHGIVSRHGGEIAVESTGVPGEGTTFRVRLRRVALRPRDRDS